MLSISLTTAPLDDADNNSPVLTFSKAMSQIFFTITSAWTTDGNKKTKIKGAILFTLIFLFVTGSGRFLIMLEYVV